MIPLFVLLIGLGGGHQLGAMALSHASQVAHLATVVLDDGKEGPIGLDQLMSPAPARRQAVPKRVRPRARDRKASRPTAAQDALQIGGLAANVLQPLAVPKQTMAVRRIANLPPPLKDWLGTVALAAEGEPAETPIVPRRDKVWVPERTLPRIVPPLLTRPR